MFTKFVLLISSYFLFASFRYNSTETLAIQCRNSLPKDKEMWLEFIKRIVRFETEVMSYNVED